MGEERDEQGRFIEGNQAATGHRRPHAARVAALRALLFEVVDAEALRSVLEALIGEAVGGDVPAARLLLSYSLGEPVAEDMVARLEELEVEVGIPMFKVVRLGDDDQGGGGFPDEAGA